MADPHWTSYVGMATGIAGAIMGYVSYRKIKQIKALDLRLELKRAVVNINSDYKKLLEQMAEGDKSRMRVASAIGMLHSGMTKKWNEELVADQAITKELERELPNKNTDYDHLDPKELETKLIEVHRTSQKISNLSKKYHEAMNWDNEQRKHIREDMRARIKT
jgi:hypothetical protein